jgi:outer membrane protein assembly factor BamE
VLLAVSGCGNIPTPGIYKLDIQQGNVITTEMLSGLESGMEKRKVRFLLGTPLVTDTFDPNRWDYLYSFQEGGGDRVQRHIVAIFENGLLVRVDGDVTPSEFSSLPTVSLGQVVTVPDQESGTLLGGVTDIFGDKDRLPLEKKPDEDDINKGFFDGIFGAGTDDENTGSGAADRDDGDVAGNEVVQQPAANPEAGSALSEDKEEAAMAAADEDEEVGFFKRLSNEFGLEPPPESLSVDR